MRPASKIALRPRRVITERPWTSSQPRTTGSNAIDRAGSPEIGRLPQGPAGWHPGLLAEREELAEPEPVHRGARRPWLPADWHPVPGGHRPDRQDRRRRRGEFGVN